MIAIFFKVKEKLREIFMSNFYSSKWTFFQKPHILRITKKNKLFLFNYNNYFYIIKTYSCQVQVRVENRWFSLVYIKDLWSNGSAPYSHFTPWWKSCNLDCRYHSMHNSCILILLKTKVKTQRHLLNFQVILWNEKEKNYGIRVRFSYKSENLVAERMFNKLSLSRKYNQITMK